MKWNSNQIVNDLKNVFTAKSIDVKITTQFPGGDYDTTGIIVTPLNQPENEEEMDDAIMIHGFNPSVIMEEENSETPEHDIPFVEIRNCFSDSDGGLSTDASEIIQQSYLAVKNYFRDLPVSIIRHYDQIF